MFQKDWSLYPAAIIDYKTSNKSALLLAGKLKIMGIKNNSFFLALHNPKLQGVDPFSPDLTIEQMGAIGLEIRNNAWYFFREIARAPAIAGLRANVVELNRANLALWWSFFNHIYFILIQPRQTGKSFSTDLLMELLYNFKCNNTQINLLTKDDKLRSENIERLKNIYEELPGYLKLKTREDANNTEEFSVKTLGNTYKTHVPNASEKRAYNIGRGMTTPIFHLDEPPFQPNIQIAMPAALAAMGAAIRSAKANDEPYGIIMTTTAGKKDEKEGKYIYDLAMGSASWSERFLDAEGPAELEEMVRAHSKEGAYRIYAVFSHTQLGKDDKWLKDELERTRATGETADRDYFNIWTSGTQSSPLPVHLIDKMNRSIMEPAYESISAIGGYILRWYIPEHQVVPFMSTRQTVIGIDTSDGSGGDDISVIITDVESGRVVAAGSFNRLNLITFCQFLVDILVKYIKSTMIIERRSTGSTVLDYLLLMLPLAGIDPFKRLFNWVVNDPMEHPERSKEMNTYMPNRSEDIYVRAKKYFGFATSAGGQTSRTMLYSDILQNAVARCADGVIDKQLVGQISGLIRKNGRIDHADGEHDDLVIGFLLCHWFLTMGKNLHVYGIDTKNILVQAVQQKPMSEDEFYLESVQQGIRGRIQELFDLLSEESDIFVCERYERELKSLDAKLILKDGESFSIDGFLNQVKEKKKQSRVSTNYYDRGDYRERMGYAVDIDRSRLDSNTIVM